MGRALLASVLARQALVLRDSLASHYPNAWLVVEARAANAAPARFETMTSMLPGAQAPKADQGADPLFLELAPATPGTRLRLGRAAGNDLVIEDPTVSREHLTLSFEGSCWAVEVVGPAKDSALAAAAPLAAGALAVMRLPSGRRTFLRSQPLPPGQKAPLADGDSLRLGDAALTYLEPTSFLKRFGAESPF